MDILNNDLELLNKIDRYARGDHDEPYLPDNADAEYRQLAKRCTTNLTEFIVGTSAQAMYVDGFRRSKSLTQVSSRNDDRLEPEWLHWQRSRLDARQSAIYRGALTFGHSFVLTEKVDGEVRSRGLSAMKTVALYDDPASDDNAMMAFTVVTAPTAEKPGRARGWDDTFAYEFTFKSLGDLKSLELVDKERHGVGECPVTRFTASVDLEGRTTGVIEPMIPLQDRLNQTVFDLLVTQSFASFKVRTITGMAPPMKTEPVYERPNGTPDNPSDKGAVVGSKLVINPITGQPEAQNININARRVMFGESKDIKFGTLDETPLDGFIQSIEMSFRHIAALSQTPPHHLLGQIANLSAEALQAAETALQRKVAEFQSSFGESWERVFRIAAMLEGDDALVEDYSGEVVWRDMEQRSLAQAGDALGKLADQLHIPVKGLWARVPDVTASEIAQWEALYDEEDSQRQLAESLDRANADGQGEQRPPDFRSEPQGAAAGPAVISDDFRFRYRYTS